MINVTDSFLNTPYVYTNFTFYPIWVFFYMLLHHILNKILYSTLTFRPECTWQTRAMVFKQTTLVKTGKSLLFYEIKSILVK